jgi:hypothetical protein
VRGPAPGEQHGSDGGGKAHAYARTGPIRESG